MAVSTEPRRKHGAFKAEIFDFVSLNALDRGWQGKGAVQVAQKAAAKHLNVPPSRLGMYKDTIARALLQKPKADSSVAVHEGNGKLKLKKGPKPASMKKEPRPAVTTGKPDFSEALLDATLTENDALKSEMAAFSAESRRLKTQVGLLRRLFSDQITRYHKMLNDMSALLNEFIPAQN